MATRKKGAKAAPTPVEAITHTDKRANLPLAGAAEFVSPEVEAPRTLLYPRDPSLDPQLVWKGKDSADASDLAVDAPPVYIQEKIDPRVLVENLRRTAGPGETEPEMTLFETFDGLGELDRVDYYRHAANWSNRMILGDSLQVMASLAERESLRGKVQMIYVDPPYGIKFGSNWQARVDRRDVRDGKAEDASREVEMIKAFRDTWENGISSYLGYLRDRLVVARDLLTETGSVFVQIGDENVHLVRSVLDEVFGSDNFVSQITFKKTSGAGSFAGGTTVLAAISDHLVWYARDAEAVKYRQIYRSKALDGDGAGQYTWIEDSAGGRRRGTPAELADPSNRVFRPAPLTSQTTRTGQTTVFPVEVEGSTYRPNKGGWKTNVDGMTRLVAADRLLPVGRTLTYVRYLDDFPAFPINNLWDDTVTSGFADPKTYVVQTNAKVIERCMLMTTDPGDLVLDPTCGSGTTAYVAEQWGRRWITIDTSRVALALARQRVMGARFPYYLLADSEAGRAKEQEITRQALAPSRPSNDIRRGFVYERVQHVTLKSIANNPDIVEGMSRDEIDAAIRRHAEFELLVDRPYEDRSTVRVAGPFTVESLSPHRSLVDTALAPAGEEHPQPASEERAADDPASTAAFEAMILENLRRAGIQNGKRKERLELDLLEPYAGTCIQAVGTRAAGPSGDTDENADDHADGDDTDPGAAPVRVGIALGPQYGTVGPRFIKAAAREAMAAGDVDLLCVLGFAFDPAAVDSTDGYVASDAGFDVAAERSLGRVPVLLVRMNADLLMGDDLKKTGAGNLFTVFGEPDIAISEKAGEVTVELRGVDVYDPTTGDVRSQGPDRVALWMIDTDYDGESFFVRHCYFTGGTDPYKRLKTALRADIDPEAWESLYSTVSRPFPRPEHGAVAVKVIDDYGDEVTKVFDLSAEA